MYMHITYIHIHMHTYPCGCIAPVVSIWIIAVVDMSFV